MRRVRTRHPKPPIHTRARCAVVFGKVIEGMDIVKTIEGFGSGAGKPSKKIEIIDCGQLA